MSTLTGWQDLGIGAPPDPREQAREERREFKQHVSDYAVVNTFLIFLWALSAGYFWPAWVLATWGVFLALHGWTTFRHWPMTDGDVDAEPSRHR